MDKIPTVFERDWDGNRGVIDKYVVDLWYIHASDYPGGVVIATEKIDGTNVRVTVRGGTAVRLEKRRNPTRAQKAKGIETPWYVDAHEDDAADKWIWEALANTDCRKVPDGEWSGEAVGPKIQGNPYDLGAHRIIFFRVGGELPQNFGPSIPRDFDGLRQWLPQQRSELNRTVPIEGVVWWTWEIAGPIAPVCKLKVKDFK